MNFSRQQVFAPIYFRELVVISENKSGQNAKVATSCIKPNFDFFKPLHIIYQSMWNFMLISKMHSFTTQQRKLVRAKSKYRPLAEINWSKNLQARKLIGAKIYTLKVVRNVFFIWRFFCHGSVSGLKISRLVSMGQLRSQLTSAFHQFQISYTHYGMVCKGKALLHARKWKSSTVQRCWFYQGR